MITWNRDSERDAYVLLRNEGIAALEARHGNAIANDLINRWADQGRVKITYPGGWLTIRTFKKYAKD